MKLNKKLTDLLQDKPDAPCKIFSKSLSCWWNEKGKGYTRDCKLAGVYTIADACKINNNLQEGEEEIKIVPLQCIEIKVAQNYLSYHPKKGTPTNFEQAILDGTKIHTIRPDFEAWAKKAEKINNGLAYLSLRKWSGLPYRSKVIEIKRLFKVGVQRARIENKCLILFGTGKASSSGYYLDSDFQNDLPQIEDLAKNDGFSDAQDFWDWFKNKPFEGAIIHFTDFRY